ncbi:phage tail protein [Enterobacter hormaechei]|uniref:phage tail protein n=1 Tax=Enterobacter hormaechei TaxID=158836 RepID=UPI00115E9B91|nr:phage tail protein [Enterobacter hormaechei]
MNKIGYSVGQAAGVGVMAVNADATLSTGSGGSSVFAGLVISRRGAPGKVLQLTASNYKDVLGAPIHPRLGLAFEPYRHVQQAVKGGDGYAVRVCPSDMKVPGIIISKASGDENQVEEGESFTLVGDYVLKAAQFGPYETPTLKDGELAIIYVKDGEASTNRTISLENDGEDSDLQLLTLSETLSDGSVVQLETHQVSFDPEAVNDMAQPAWLQTMLESMSTRLGCVITSDDSDDMFSGLTFSDVAFVGGSDGTFSKITAEEYLKALATLEAAPVNVTAILSLGCYDSTVIAALKDLAEAVRVDFFYDLSGNQMAVAAIAEAKGHGFGGSHQPSRYYFPCSCKDSATGMQVVFGISCDAFVAKAKGVAMVPDVGGWHYSPAGTSRGIIDRQNITKIPNLDSIDLEAFVTARINPVKVAANGDVYIDDALTTLSKKNYLRFQHVSSLMNAIARNFYELAEAIKHEPDGVTQESLTKGMTALLERFYAAGALVKPRDTSQGTEPFVITVTQLEIDLWQVEWAVCPTGTARRIIGKPILMR